MTDRDRLIEALKEILPTRGTAGGIPIIQKWDYGATADKLLEKGVILPPCKVGDTVYVVSQGQGFCMRWNVYEGKVVDIHLNRHNKLTIRVENGEKFFGYYEPRFIFLTPEEAEQALERSNDNA